MGSALGCVGGIACLSSQETARLGIYVGMSGIGTGLASTLAYMSPESIETYGQLLLMGGSGAAAGYFISTKIGPTELPQAVAAFHSLVGLAATFTAVGDFMGKDVSADFFVLSHLLLSNNDSNKSVTTLFVLLSARHGTRICIPQPQYVLGCVDGQHYRHWLGTFTSYPSYCFNRDSLTSAVPFICLLLLLMIVSFASSTHTLHFGLPSGYRIWKALWSIIVQRPPACVTRSH